MSPWLLAAAMSALAFTAAPALAQADVGIAMGAAGSDVAIHSATIALMNNNLNRIPFLIELSRITSRVIKQNVVIGVLFIVIFLSLSGMGLINAMMAAVLHLLSGLVVVFNSARLVRSGEEIEQVEATELEEIASQSQIAAPGEVATAG